MAREIEYFTEDHMMLCEAFYSQAKRGLVSVFRWDGYGICLHCGEAISWDYV